MVSTYGSYTELAEELMKATSSKIQSLKTLNIVIIGKTGVGKSTLINTVFREEVAETGRGYPVTEKMKKYEKKGFPLGIYDTKGFELGKEAQKEVKKELLQTIQKGVDSGDINKSIHCIWYCVNATSNRFEQEEINWIKDFTKDDVNKVPVIIVLTQSISKKRAQEMKEVIDAANLDIIQIVPVLAQNYEVEIDDNIRLVKAYGVDKLVEIMTEILPDELGDTLMYVQQANLKLKQKKAHATVVAAATSAMAEGATPIPFSDAALLIPTEIAMFASITTIFGFDLDKSVLMGLISSVLGAGGATIGGRTIVTNLLKMIPGVGTVAGGVISGATALTLTTALGEAYIGIMTAISKGELQEKELQTQEGKDKLNRMYKERLKKGQHNKQIFESM